MISKANLEEIARNLLQEIGEDPSRDGLVDTPRRFANWWSEFASYEPGELDTTFEAKGANEIIVVSGIHVWSICEHHLLPFSCSISVGYRAEGQIIGISKLARIAQKYAHRLQVQERLVAQIADEVSTILGVPDVAAIGAGEHLCMTMRGIRTPATAKTTAFRGAFAESAESRAELMRLIELDAR